MSWVSLLVVLLMMAVATAEDDPDAESSLESELLAATGVLRPTRRRPLRPSLSVSDRIMPIQLVDTLDGVQVPRRRHLRVQALMAALGADFDSFWMSIEKPQRPVESETRANHLDSELVQQLKDLNVSAQLGPDVESAAVGAIEHYLVRKATCPIRYVWDDVGPLFWPRWVKRGECPDSGTGSMPCSWPKGMHCVPAESTTNRLLRWHCRPRGRRMPVLPHSSDDNHSKQMQRDQDAKNLRCQWLKVPYPVTSRCVCSC